MRSVVTTAKTREAAIEAALRQLGVERHEVAVEILDEGSRGFLGFGSRDVQIRVTAEHLPDEPEPQPEQTESRGRGARRDDGKERRPRPERSSNPQGAQSNAKPRQGENRGQQRSRGSENKGSDKKPDRAEGSGRQGARGQNRNPARGGEARADQSVKGNSEGSGESKPTGDTPMPLTPGEVTATSALLEEMVRLMGMEATVVSRASDDGGIILSVESPDSAILIGRKGRNLQAIQYLINRMARTGESHDMDRIIVDIEGYIERRKASLEEMAQRLARKAKDTGRRIRVKPMSPPERRVVHMTLQDDPDVRTFSIGDTPVRCLIIAPKDEKLPKRRASGGRRGGRGRSGAREQATNVSTPSPDDADHDGADS